MDVSKSIIGTLLKMMHKIIHFILEQCFHKHISEKQWIMIDQFLKFGIVGVSNTIISYVLYMVFLIFFKSKNVFPTYNYLIAQVISFLLSVLWSFYWNNKYVFMKQTGEQRSLLYSLLKTYASYSFTGIFLNSLLLIIWVKFLNISEFIAPIINLLVSVPLNFLINKYWAFRSK